MFRRAIGRMGPAYFFLSILIDLVHDFLPHLGHCKYFDDGPCGLVKSLNGEIEY